jgi:hypothetical protein
MSGDIPEGRHPKQCVDESRRGMFDGFDHGDEASTILVAHERTELPKRRGKVPHELTSAWMVQLLSEQAGTLFRAHLAEFVGRPRPVPPKPVSEGGCHQKIPGEAVSRAQIREVPRSEVHGVQREDVGDCRGTVPQVVVFWFQEWPRERAGRRQISRVRIDALAPDVHGRGALGDLGAASPNRVEYMGGHG